MSTQQQEEAVPPSSDTSMSTRDSTLNITTGPSSQLYPKDQPESLVTRKRSDASKEHVSGQDMDLQDGASSDGSDDHTRTFPPLKRSKTSPPLLQPNPSLTEYRPSQEAVVVDDSISPPTSPQLDATEPRSLASTLAHHRRITPLNWRAPPLLKRSRTSDGIRSSGANALIPGLSRHSSAFVDGFSKSDETAIEKLTLGEPTEGPSTVGERTMGVITTLPAFRRSRETTPMQAEESSIHSPQPLHPLSPSSSNTANSPDSTTEDVSSPDNRFTTQYLLETSPEYDEDGDDDYDSDDANTTVDEYNERVDSDTDDEDPDELFAEINVHNIEIPGILDMPFSDDPACNDVLSEEEKAKIIAESRNEGVAFVIQKYIMSRIHSIIKLLMMTGMEKDEVPRNCTENDLISIFSGRLEAMIKRRERLKDIHTLEQAVDLIKNSKKIMVLTGAGVSVSCGIPDFRSPNGIYARLAEFELDDPTDMFDLEVFVERPELFYSFAHEIYPSNFTPSPSHHFVKLLETRGKLLRNYTQNIDTLEQKAGIHNVLQCHGSFATARCIRCKRHVDGAMIEDSIMKQQVAYCQVCKEDLFINSNDSEDKTDPPPLMKPDIVFFNEALPFEFGEYFDKDRDETDLLIVMGSSLKVEPVSDIMYKLPPNVPQILINRTPITHTEFDVQLMGNCDTIVAELCRLAGWELRHEKLPGGSSNVPNASGNNGTEKRAEGEESVEIDGSGQGGHAPWTLVEPNTYLFEGAIAGPIEFESTQQGKGRKRAWMDTDGDEGTSMEALHESFRRRESSHRERFGSTGMETDTESETSVGDDGGHHYHLSLAEFGSYPREGIWLGSPGFFRGTTESQSGDTDDVYHAADSHVAEDDQSKDDVYGEALALGTQNRRGSGSSLESQLVVAEEEDEEQAEIRTMFTEKMPKDLGESSSNETTTDGQDTNHSDGRLLNKVDLEVFLEDKDGLEGVDPSAFDDDMDTPPSSQTMIESTESHTMEAMESKSEQENVTTLTDTTMTNQVPKDAIVNRSDNNASQSENHHKLESTTDQISHSNSQDSLESNDSFELPSFTVEVAMAVGDWDEDNKDE
ncbi:NAD-dependent histone deacetylase sir2 [Podila epigama]|nr:NAD-dependent histone deacetylase sir2 [Podila epigama]